MPKKNDPYEVEKKPPIISHIAGRRLRNASAFGARQKPGGPIAGRSRKFRGIEPPSPVKPEDRNPSRGKPINISMAAAKAQHKGPEFEYEQPKHRVDVDELADGTKLKFDGDPRIHEYTVTVVEDEKILGKVRRITCDTDKLKTEWEAQDGEWHEVFPTRLVAARALFDRIKKS